MSAQVLANIPQSPSDGVDVVFADPMPKEEVPEEMKFDFEEDSSCAVPYYLQGWITIIHTIRIRCSDS